MIVSLLALLPSCGRRGGNSGRISGAKGNEPTCGTRAAAAGVPAETKPANAPGQRPAFAGQTRAPMLTRDDGRIVRLTPRPDANEANDANRGHNVNDAK